MSKDDFLNIDVYRYDYLSEDGRRKLTEFRECGTGRRVCVCKNVVAVFLAGLFKKLPMPGIEKVCSYDEVYESETSRIVGISGYLLWQTDSEICVFFKSHIGSNDFERICGYKRRVVLGRA